MNPIQQEIFEESLEIARSFERFEARLIQNLIKVERERVHLERGHSSLFAYALQDLKLSPAVTANAITVARKARVVPELKASIEEGSLGISVARKICSVLTPENQSEWLTKAKSLTCRQLEKE